MTPKRRRFTIERTVGWCNQLGQDQAEVSIKKDGEEFFALSVPFNTSDENTPVYLDMVMEALEALAKEANE